MKDLYDNPVFAEMFEHVKNHKLTPEFISGQVMDEIVARLADGEVTLEATEGGISVRAVHEGRVRYTVPETMASPEELFINVVGSGAFGFGSAWWSDLEWTGVDDDGTVSGDWQVRVRYGVEGETDIVEGVINAETLAQAVMRIASGAARLREEFTSECAKLAAGLLDDVDIDAWVGDGIMQVAITGDTADFG